MLIGSITNQISTLDYMICITRRITTNYDACQRTGAMLVVQKHLVCSRCKYFDLCLESTYHTLVSIRVRIHNSIVLYIIYRPFKNYTKPLSFNFVSSSSCLSTFGVSCTDLAVVFLLYVPTENIKPKHASIADTHIVFEKAFAYAIRSAAAGFEGVSWVACSTIIPRIAVLAAMPILPPSTRACATMP